VSWIQITTEHPGLIIETTLFSGSISSLSHLSKMNPAVKQNDFEMLKHFEDINISNSSDQIKVFGFSYVIYLINPFFRMVNALGEKASSSNCNGISSVTTT